MLPRHGVYSPTYKDARMGIMPGSSVYLCRYAMGIKPVDLWLMGFFVGFLEGFMKFIISQPSRLSAIYDTHCMLINAYNMYSIAM